MMLIDTHSHLYCEDFDIDRNEAVERAKTAGVGMILLPAIDSDTYDRQELLTKSNPSLFKQMMGVHPTSIGRNPENDLREARSRLFADPDKYIAIGEIGLDLYWDSTYKQQQLYALRKQIEWADTLDKPIVLHIRNAYSEALELLNEIKQSRYKGIMHCFSGTLEQAHEAIGMGFLLGIGGVVTYKKSTLADIVKHIPLTSMVLETDAPYLPPVPHRGKRNESAYLTLIAEKIAQLKEVSVETVSSATTDNATKLFDLQL